MSAAGSSPGPKADGSNNEDEARVPKFLLISLESAAVPAAVALGTAAIIINSSNRNIAKQAIVTTRTASDAADQISRIAKIANSTAWMANGTANQALNYTNQNTNATEEIGILKGEVANLTDTVANLAIAVEGLLSTSASSAAATTTSTFDHDYGSAAVRSVPMEKWVWMIVGGAVYVLV